MVSLSSWVAQCAFFFFEVAFIIADEAAHKSIWNLKGASAIRSCIDCWNVVDHKHPGYVGRGILPSTCVDKSKLKMYTDEGLQKLYDNVADAATKCRTRKIKQYDFDAKQLKAGITYSESGMMFDLSLRPILKPVKMRMWDWCHIFFVAGVFNYEVMGLMTFLIARGSGRISWNVLHHWVSGFTWPKAQHSHTGSDMFSADRKPKHDAEYIKCSASEGLNVYLVIADFVRTFAGGMSCEPQIASYLVLCAVIDALSGIKHRRTSSLMLDRLVTDFLTLHQVAYGTILWIPKHHMSIHLAKQFAVHLLLVACFVLERHHKMAKQFILGKNNLKSFEIGLVEEMTVQHLFRLKSWRPTDLNYCLHSLHAPKKDEAEQLMQVFPGRRIQIASHATIDFTELHAGDVVCLHDGRIGELWFFVRAGDADYACVAFWECDENIAESHCVECNVLDEATLVPATGCWCPLTFRFSASRRTARVVVPALVRNQPDL